MTTFIFENARIFDGVSEDLLEAHHVLVEGEVIKEVSPKPVKAQQGERLDLEGRVLMPGLIDAHGHAVATDVHLGSLGERPTTLLAHQAAQILESMLQRGFTTLRDAGGADVGLAEAVASGLIAGPRLFYSGQALTPTGGHGDFRALGGGFDTCACRQALGPMSVIADGVPEVRRAAREQLRKGATQIKIMASGGIASPRDPVWNLQYSEAEIRAVVEEAAFWRSYVMAHAYTAEAIRRSVEFGVRSIEHGNLIDRETATFVASEEAFVVPTLVTYDALERHGAELGLPAESLAKLQDVRAAGLSSLEHLKAAGVKTGFGTDLLGAMHRYQSDEFLIRAQVYSPAEVLRQATSANAELLNMRGRLGVVAPEAFADLIVVEGDPLEDLNLLRDQGTHLPVIMKAGRFYKQTLR